MAVRVTVRAKHSAVAGLVTGSDGRPALAVRLAAPPVDGAANKALRRFLADRLELPVSDVVIASGARSRLKVIELVGDPGMLAQRLRAMIET